MLFNSFDFLFFITICFVLYWFVLDKKLRWQNLFILIISYVFYGWWDWRFLSLIIASSLLDYFASRQIDNSTKTSHRKFYLVFSLIANLGLLCAFKYFNFFSQSLVSALAFFGIELDQFTLSVILPVGISFYTFQTMSYTIDVYFKKMEPAKDIISFLAYVSFFPQLVAGPIERASSLLPQFFTSRKFTYRLGYDGVRMIIWGLFKKMVIADNCAVLVNTIFAGHETASSLELMVGAVLFAFQIYGDFSGYSDIASGSAKLFGFELMTNFKTPYFSRDIAEFWRRWHISLSTWFRDYVYIPLGGSKGSPIRSFVNVMLIFLLSGLWHGANWTFITWGAINASYFLPLMILGRNRNNLEPVTKNRYWPGLKNIAAILTTFLLTCLAWIFFRAENIQQAIDYLLRIFLDRTFLVTLVTMRSVVICFISIGVLVLIEWFFQWEQIPFLKPRKVEWPSRLFYLMIITLILFFRHFGQKLEFIYFQF